MRIVRKGNRSKAKLRKEAVVWKFLEKNKEVFEKDEMANGGILPQGPYFYQEGGKTFCSLPIEMLQGIMTCPHYQQMM